MDALKLETRSKISERIDRVIASGPALGEDVALYSPDQLGAAFAARWIRLFVIEE